MTRFSILLLLAALPFMDTSEGRSFRELFHQVWEEIAYDKLVLAYRWAPSYCKKEDCHIQITALKQWTIRGFWPLRAMRNLNQKTTVKGTTIEMKSTKEAYEKHGACLNDLEKFNTVTKYFRNTLDLWSKYKIKDILANGDQPVRPSNTKKYTLREITSALNKGLGVNPAVYCVEEDNKQYLSEVRMCFNKKLVAISCGDALVGGARCDSEKKVFYPLFPPLVIG